MCTVMVSPIEYSIHHITDCIQSGDFIEFATLVGIILHNYFTVYSRVLVCDSRIGIATATCSQFTFNPFSCY
jgi:hypothetical protein